jgi:hypothetical protein
MYAQQKQTLDAFYNLKKKIVELSLADETMKSLMESLASLESNLTRKETPSLDEIDLTLSKHRDLVCQSQKAAGPSKAMQAYVKNDQLQSARRVDWIIAYGKLCDARCDLAEAEVEEKRLSDLYRSTIKYID